MKHLKMLGLAAIAALGLMAFVGAGTASATTITTDAAGTIKYPAGTEIHVTMVPGTSTVFEKTNGELIATCTETTVRGTIGIATGTWVSGEATAVTQNGCSQTTDTITTGRGEIMKTGPDEGEGVGKETNTTLQVFGVSCTYGTGEGTRVDSMKGGESPELSVNVILPRTAGSTLFCPSTGRWTAGFIVTSPHALHIIE